MGKLKVASFFCGCGGTDDGLIDDLIIWKTLCDQYKKVPSRKVVGFTNSYEFDCY